MHERVYTVPAESFFIVPVNDDPVFNRGVSLLHRHRPADAVALAMSIPSWQGHPGALKLVGIVEQLTGKKSQSDDRFHRLNDIGGRDNQCAAYANLAAGSFRAGAFDQAIEQSQRAIAIDPTKLIPYTIWLSAIGRAGTPNDKENAARAFRYIYPGFMSRPTAQLVLRDPDADGIASSLIAVFSDRDRQELSH